VPTGVVSAEPQFDWDDANHDHVARHAVSRGEAEQAICDPHAAMLDIQYLEVEERSKIVGMTKAGRILTVLFTFRKGLVRPITAYDATPKDVEVYLKGRR